MPPAKLSYRQARFSFPQEANDLFFRESLLHVQSPVVGIGLQAQLLLKAGKRRGCLAMRARSINASCDSQAEVVLPALNSIFDKDLIAIALCYI